MFQILQIVIANEVKQSHEIAASSRIAGFLAMATLGARIFDSRLLAGRCFEFLKYGRL